MKPKKIAVLAVLSGIATTLLFFMLINQANTGTNAAEVEVNKVNVITAAADIEQDKEITEELVSIKEIPENQVHASAVKKVEEVLGHHTSTPVKKDEVILEHRIQAKTEETEMVSRKIQEDYRGVSIEVNYVTGISNLIQPEDFVDVVLTVEEPVDTEIILERVRVLAVGERMTESKGNSEASEYLAVTLELNQKDTAEVVNASKRGDLQLALYSKSEPEPNDKEDIEVKTIEGQKIITLKPKSNIRMLPDLDAPILTVVDKDTDLTVLDEQVNGEIKWFKVEMKDEKKGWVSSRIVETIED